jgi:hypothetical protein
MSISQKRKQLHRFHLSDETLYINMNQCHHILDIPMFNEKKMKHSIPYIKKGLNPIIGVDTGTHGDEYKVIHSLQLFISNNFSDLPDFLYIPKMSPSAVRKHTRENEDQVDINRVFFSNSPFREVQEIQSILRQYRNLLYYSFHVDTGCRKFYMYDTGRMTHEELDIYRNSMHKNAIGLFSGIDDTDLGCEVYEGYVSFLDYPDTMNGSVVNWTMHEGIITRAFVIEIPGLVHQHEMNRITSVVFPILLNITFPKLTIQV